DAEGHEIHDDGRDQAWNERRIPADEGLADEARDLRDRGEDRDVADQQIAEGLRLVRDYLPFRPRPQHDRLGPLDQPHRLPPIFPLPGPFVVPRSPRPGAPVTPLSRTAGPAPAPTIFRDSPENLQADSGSTEGPLQACRLGCG